MRMNKYGKVGTAMTSGLRNNEQRLMELTSKNDEYIDLPYNVHYSYCYVDRAAIADDLESYIKEYAEDEFQMTQQELNNLELVVILALKKICYDLENIGYDWFYEIDSDEVNEIAETNNIEFLKDGGLWP